MSVLSLRQMYIEDKYLVLHTIGSGHFGDIRAAKNIETNEVIAVKLEERTDSSSKLIQEKRIYDILKETYVNNTHKKLQTTESFFGFPETFGCGQFDKYNFLLLELFGYNLESLFNACERKFTVKCVGRIGLQMLSRLEFVHSCKIVYRDMKPENFVVHKDLPNFGHRIFMLDFGLAKEMEEQVNSKSMGSFNQGRPSRKVVGTCRYMSVNAHKGVEQSQRDDLESLAYIMVYFLKGTLPWQGVTAEEIHEKYQKIFDLKKSMSLTQLCKGLPTEIQQLLAYTKLMDPVETPNYAYIRTLFVNLISNAKDRSDGPQYDWLSGTVISILDGKNPYTHDDIIRSDEIFCTDKSSKCNCCGLKRVTK